MPPDWDAPGTPFIGMPGNPVSLFVTFCLFVRPFIRRLQGIAVDLAPRPWWLPAGFEWPKAGGREEFPRARLVPDAERGLEVRLYPSHSSAVLSSVTWAEGLAVIPIGQTLRQGDPVQFLPLRELQP
jgi:molybdopterin molybdotransferase